MILEWSLENFKSVRQIPKLSFAPLTIVCGANSSGKSTLIQSILMISQTLGSPNVGRPLVLNGELIKLGYLDDVLHYGMNAKQISIECKMEWSGSTRRFVESPAQEVEFALAFERSDKSNAQTSKVNLIRSFLHFNELSINVQAIRGGDLIDRINLNRYEITPELREDLKAGKYDYQYEIRPNDEQRIPVGKDANLFSSRCSLRHFLPYYSLENYDAEEERTREFLDEIATLINNTNIKPSDQLAQIKMGDSIGQIIRDALLGAIDRVDRTTKSSASSSTPQVISSIQKRLKDVNSITDWITFVQVILVNHSFLKRRLSDEITWYAVGRREIKNRNRRIGIKPSPLSLDITRITDKITDFFTNGIKYLGPLRDDPKMIFSLPPIPDMKDVGMKGEFTAAVLERFGKDIYVDCPFPPTSDRFVFKKEKMLLIDAVTLWLNHMELVNKVVTTDFAKMGVGLTVVDNGSGKQLDLTNVGVGVSQVLPLLTVCLLTPVDGTVLIEQPELHLHPKVQSMLGDFFIGIAARGTQCVLETHSDRLINRVRRRIAEDMDDKVYKLSRIYMIEKESSETTVLPVEPNEYGAIPRWPKGFFDEGPDESSKIVEAQTRKREARMKKQGEK